MIILITGCVIDSTREYEEIVDEKRVEDTDPEDKNDEARDDKSSKEEFTYELTEEGIIRPEDAERIIKETAYEVLEAIRDKDAEKISAFVHPTKGLRFTPYTYVSVEDDPVFTQEEMKNFFRDRKKYLWGYYDGIGDEIILTPSEYYEKFVYTADFVEAEEVGYNEVLSSGNMLENQFEVYENPIVVEHYFPNFDPDFYGMDWRSLRLVFEEYEGSWVLVGIIHNQWTI